MIKILVRDYAFQLETNQILFSYFIIKQVYLIENLDFGKENKISNYHFFKKWFFHKSRI